MTVRQAMCVRDEGRSLGAGLRRQAPNHLERLGSRAPVVSVKEKARRDRVRCGSGRRTRVNHRRSVESVGTTSKPGSSRCPGISAGGDPLTASVASGIKVARVRSWLEQGTWEPVASMLREKLKWKTHESLSTDAGPRGGWACSSVEVPVMGMERRGPITRFRRRVNPAMGRNLAGKRRQSLRLRCQVNPAMGRNLAGRRGPGRVIRAG
jgi:hypothetical protein